jgi:hypothetical protein
VPLSPVDRADQHDVLRNPVMDAIEKAIRNSMSHEDVNRSVPVASCTFRKLHSFRRSPI